MAAERLERIEAHVSGLAGRMGRVEQRLERVEQKVDRLDQKVDRLDDKIDNGVTRLETLMQSFIDRQEAINRELSDRDTNHEERIAALRAILLRATTE